MMLPDEASTAVAPVGAGVWASDTFCHLRGSNRHPEILALRNRTFRMPCGENGRTATTPWTSQNCHGWTPDEADRLGSYFLELVHDIDHAGPYGTTGMSKWFDFAAITLQDEGELKTVAHDRN
jgi:hypothetical protein